MKENTCLTHPCPVLAARAEARLQSPTTARSACTHFLHLQRYCGESRKEFAMLTSFLSTSVKRFHKIWRNETLSYTWAIP